MSDEHPTFRYIKAVIPRTIISAHLGKHVPAGTMIVRDISGRLTGYGEDDNEVTVIKEKENADE